MGVEGSSVAGGVVGGGPKELAEGPISIEPSIGVNSPGSKGVDEWFISR